MATRLGDVLHHLGYVALARESDGLTDAELLDRFLTRREEAAFAALVRRHGPMVLSVCRRLLRHTQDAEDAFQATFLVLVKKAATIARRELLGNWLYGVAYRTASKARVAAARRQAREQQVDDAAGAESTPRASDALALLDEELNRLPEKYRTPLILCDLEGRSRGEAAQRLDCPLGTLSSRLARGRQMLRQRLIRRGVTVTAMVAVWAENASAAIPTSLLVGTIRVGLRYTMGLGVVSAPLAALTEGVLQTMLLTKLKIATLVVLALTVAGAGAGLLLHANPAVETPAAPRTEKATLAGEAPPPPARSALDALLDTHLLRTESVQKELKPNDKQRRKIQTIRTDIRAKHKEELDKTIERRILKEPAYRSKPKYCLLVLGPEVKTRVWLVQDGDTLYVDRNGNGDLTEANEKVPAEKRKNQDPNDPNRTFVAGELREGGRRHLNLSVSVGDLNRVKEGLPEAKALLQRDPKARQYNIGLEIEMSGYQGLGVNGRLVQGAGLDSNGLLQFADRPQDAPIIHFGGPWTIHFYQQTTLWLGRENNVALVFGTPGLGAGSFAYIGYEGVVPDNVAPRIDITFPSRKPGGSPVTASYNLEERC